MTDHRPPGRDGRLSACCSSSTSTA